MFRSLIAYCCAANATLSEPVTASAVRKAFASIHRNATDDVVSYFTQFGGMADGDCDDHMLSLWTLDRLVAEHKGLTNESWPFVYFGDWLISSHLYALRPETDIRSSVHIDYICDCSTPPEPVADDIFQFAAMLVSDPTSVGVVL